MKETHHDTSTHHRPHRACSCGGLATLSTDTHAFWMTCTRCGQRGKKATTSYRAAYLWNLGELWQDE